MALITLREQKALNRLFPKVIQEFGFRPEALESLGFGDLLASISDPLPALEEGKVLGVVSGALAWVDDQAGSTGNYVFDDDSVDLAASGVMVLGGANSTSILANSKLTIASGVGGLDLSSAAALEIGVATATSVVIGRADQHAMVISNSDITIKNNDTAIGTIQDDGSGNIYMKAPSAGKVSGLMSFNGTGVIKTGDAVGSIIGFGTPATTVRVDDKIHMGFAGAEVGSWRTDGASGMKWVPDANTSTFIKSSDETAWLEIKQSRADLVAQGGQDGFKAANGEVYITIGGQNAFATLANTTKLLASGHEGIHVQWDGANTKLGFYGAATVAQQTGVAVDIAAVHAALVNLGLITA